MTLDGGEDIIEVVGDATGQSADSFHLLRLLELFFKNLDVGAVHADADEILAGFARTAGDENIEVECAPVSLDRLEWEYIQKTLNECGGNISTAAKRLGLHRRTLQRKLQKRPSGIK